MKICEGVYSVLREKYKNQLEELDKTAGE
jgi:hypothetical protein